MKFTIISDTHRMGAAAIENLLPQINSGDYLVHLGDGLDDLLPFESDITCKKIYVCGNCDLFVRGVPKDIFLETEAGKILFTHGDMHYVKGGNLLSLYLFAAENNCRYVFYGHTHVSDIKFKNDITFINPGSLTRPRLGLPSYCEATIENRQLNPKIVLI